MNRSIDPAAGNALSAREARAEAAEPAATPSRSARHAAAVVTIAYTVVGLAWIAISDSVLPQLVSVERWPLLSQLKGFAFIGVSAALLYCIISRQSQAMSVAHEALFQQKREFRMLFEATPYPMWVYDLDTLEFLAVNDAAIRQYGYSRDEFLTMTLEDLRTPEMLPDLRAYIASIERDKIAERVCQHRHKNGAIRDVKVAGSSISFGGRQARIVTVEDITERRLAEEQQRLAATAYATTADGIVITDANLSIVAINPAFTRMTGYTTDEALGQRPMTLNGDSDAWADLLQGLRERGQWEGEIVRKRKNGTLYPSWTTVSAARDEQGRTTHFVGVVRDISDQKRAEKEIRHLAYFDALTGLPNRRMLEDRIKQMQANHARRGGEFSLLFVDIDDFKAVNDSLGYVTGDALLQHIADTLRQSVREADTVARWGGDEFVVILEDTGADGAAKVADKVFESLARPCFVEGRLATVGACIGISVYPRDGEECTMLLSSAGAAVHRAKQLGRNTRHYFHSGLNTEARARLELEEALRGALLGNELSLHFQPQVNLATGDVTCVESLVRWTHPRLGNVSPARFIPVAESLGLIHELGRWIMTEACRTARRWLDHGLSVPVGVNLSAVQLRSETFVADVEAVLRETGLPANRLEFEVTEGVIVQWNERTEEQFRKLGELGVKLAIDDFGTGYSSLAYICRLPVSKLKIDRAFVRDLTRETKNQAILEAIVAVGHKLRIRVVAEGVETHQQAEVLRTLHCPEVQGYWTARPMPGDQFAQWCAARSQVRLLPAPAAEGTDAVMG